MANETATLAGYVVKPVTPWETASGDRAVYDPPCTPFGAARSAPTYGRGTLVDIATTHLLDSGTF